MAHRRKRAAHSLGPLTRQPSRSRPFHSSTQPFPLAAHASGVIEPSPAFCRHLALRKEGNKPWPRKRVLAPARFGITPLVDPVRRQCEWAPILSAFFAETEESILSFSRIR
jgi:hypothetical protein